MATLSVVMATYNGARFLPEQLGSLAAQTITPDELIVSDDGSTDGTLEIVEEFSRTAPFRVVLRRNERRLGYGENFLSAAKLAVGDYIAFCDQDDVWCAEKVEIALGELARTDADLLVHPAKIIDASGVPADRGFDQGITHGRVCGPLELAPWSVFYGFTMVFPARLLRLIDSAQRGRHTYEHDGMLSHDLWVYFLATSLGSVIFESRPLAAYRQHGNNATPAILGGGIRAWTASLGVAVHSGLPRHEIAYHRSQILDGLSVSSDVRSVRQAAARAAMYWRRIGRYESARVALYAASGMPRRALRCVGLVRSGGYRNFRRGGLGRRLLVKDVLAGVFRLRRSAKG